MVQVKDTAHMPDGEPVKYELNVPKVPADPKDDYPAAAKAVWRLMLAKAEVAPATKAYMSDRDGRKGWILEGKMAACIPELWPNLYKSEFAAVYQAMRTYSGDNIQVAVRGRGDVPSLWWVAAEWVDVDKAFDPSRVRRPKPAKGPKATVGDQRVSCETCGKVFASDQYLAQHVPTHERELESAKKLLGVSEETVEGVTAKVTQNGSETRVEPLERVTIQAPAGAAGPAGAMAFLEYVRDLEARQGDVARLKDRIREVLEEF